MVVLTISRGSSSGNFVSALNDLRRSIGEIARQTPTPHDEPEEPEEDEGRENIEDKPSRALEFFDLAEQVISGIRAIVQEWFHVVGFFAEADRSFVVVSVDGRLWRYFYTVDSEKDEVVIGDGSRVKYSFQDVADEDGTRMEKKEEERMGDMEDDEADEARATTDDETVDAELEDQTNPVDEDMDEDGKSRSQLPDGFLAEIFAKTELLVNRI